jgi:hypothetical protein
MAHASPQRPAAHVAEALAPAAQALPHRPQLATSLLVSAHVPLVVQSVWPVAHEVPHAPPLQTCPVGHAWPHAPQSVRLVAVLVSQPVVGSPSQSAKPVAHAVRAHTPALHAPVAWAGAHAWPHAPHAARLVRRSVSQPLPAAPSQSPKPGSQLAMHALATHEASRCGPVGHARPHAPQWCA